MNFSDAQRLYEKSLEKAISADDLAVIADWPLEEVSLLFAAADKVRRHFFGATVDPCTLMNVKAGGCGEDCAFCAQSTHNAANVTVQPLASAHEIVRQCKEAARRGLAFCVVSSGRRLPRKEVEQIAAALAQCDAEKHASLGILDQEEFALLARAGVTCYNHNLETSRGFFPRICTTHAYDDRVATVRRAKAADMRVCCGGIFGLGETWRDRMDLCLELAGLDIHTIPINFFNPIPGTRVPAPREPAMEFLKIVSMFRLAHPDRTIKVCGGRELHLGKLQGLMFAAGANGYIAGNYLTTPGDSIESDEAMIAGLGLVKDKRETRLGISDLGLRIADLRK